MKPAFLVVDKPAGITSHDVVAMIRAVTGVKKVGHTGTLDPFATGVLPLALGPATRLIQYLDESLKVYDATIALGTETDTGDPTGTVIRTADVPTLDRAVIESVLADLVGEQMQVPPAYSAVKKDGRPLYHYARKGETVTVDARPITIYGIDLLEVGEAHVRILLRCSRGTYARVLAVDIANALGTAGHLSALARRQSGPFKLEGALTMPHLAELAAEEPGQEWPAVLMARRGEERVKWAPRDTVRDALAPHLISLTDALSHLPVQVVDAAATQKIREGGKLAAHPDGLSPGDRFAVVGDAGLVAIAEVTDEGARAIRVVGVEKPPRRKPRRRSA